MSMVEWLPSCVRVGWRQAVGWMGLMAVPALLHGGVSELALPVCLEECAAENAGVGHRRECAALTTRPKAMAEELRCKSEAT